MSKEKQETVETVETANKIIEELKRTPGKEISSQSKIRAFRTEDKRNSEKYTISSKWSRRHAKQIFEKIKDGPANYAKENETRRKLVLDDCEDLYNILFSPTTKIKKDLAIAGREQFPEFIDSISGDTFENLRRTCEYSPHKSEIVTEVLMEEYSAFLRRRRKKESDKKIAKKTLARAIKAAQHSEKCISISGAGQGSSSGQCSNNQEVPQEEIESLRKLVKLANMSEDIKTILEIAGRMKEIAILAQNEKRKENPSGEISGVITGRSINRLLPSEAAKLCDPELEDSILLSIAEGKALNWEIHNRTPLGKGPIICCIDYSSSMKKASNNISAYQWAAAITITLLWLATQQKRGFHLKLFNSSTMWDADIPPKASNTIRTQTICKLIQQRPYGSTRYVPPLKYALKWMSHNEHSDLIFITDGIPSDTECAIDIMKEQKPKNSKAIGIGIEIGRDFKYDPTKVLSRFCDTAISIGSQEISGLYDKNVCKTLFSI